MKNIVKSFANQIDGVILENNAKTNLFSLLVKMIKNSEKNINLDELKRTFREIKINYVDNLNLEYYISEENRIYVDKSIFEKSDIERNYILNRVLIRVLILKNSNDRTLLSIAMEEALADLATNYAILNNNLTREPIESKNRVNRDFVEMLLFLSSNKSGLITEYLFGNARIFLGKLRTTLAKKNLNFSCYNNLSNLIHDENVVENGDFDCIFNQTDFNQLVDMCYNENLLSLMTIFEYNNIFFEKYIIDKYLQNNRSLEKFEMFILNIPSKNKLKLTDDFGLLEEYLKNQPEDFYRLRPYINEENLPRHIIDILDKFDQEFNAIVSNIDNGLVVSGINEYTYCYNPKADSIDRRIFLEQLVLSNGITNGFLLNELLEIIKRIDIKKIKNDADKEYIYNLIFEGTKQFLNNSYLNSDKPYDAYTSKVLDNAKPLLDKYRVKNPITIPVDYQSIDFVNDFVNDYEDKRRIETHYLFLRFYYSNFLRNPSTFDFSTLMKIVNDENIVVYKKYFEGILNEQLKNKRRRYQR